ncbi:MAG: hypothetical protein JWQ09_1851 [Segetibacter sp.]|nr:hypothetical protein [Segetibacter sp.]
MAIHLTTNLLKADMPYPFTVASKKSSDKYINYLKKEKEMLLKKY